MKELTFDARQGSTLPTHGRATVVITVLLHALLLLAVIRIRTQPVRMGPAGSTQGGIAAYVSGPVGTVGRSEPNSAVEQKRTIARAAKAAPQEDQSSAQQSAGAAGMVGGQPGGGPVRLGSGGSLTLLNKVTPVYPSIMQSARVPGQVVLDAIIHQDGTIGEVTVLRSTNDAFARAAIAAVKQWRYTPIPYEGIVTVTVNFTIPG